MRSPKISLFFPFPPQLSFFLLSLSLGSFRGILWCLKRWGLEMCTFGLSGCRVTQGGRRGGVVSPRGEGGFTQRGFTQKGEEVTQKEREGSPKREGWRGRGHPGGEGPSSGFFTKGEGGRVRGLWPALVKPTSAITKSAKRSLPKTMFSQPKFGQPNFKQPKFNQTNFLPNLTQTIMAKLACAAVPHLVPFQPHQATRAASPPGPPPLRTQFLVLRVVLGVLDPPPDRPKFRSCFSLSRSNFRSLLSGGLWNLGGVFEARDIKLPARPFGAPPGPPLTSTRTRPTRTARTPQSPRPSKRNLAKHGAGQSWLNVLLHQKGVHEGGGGVHPGGGAFQGFVASGRRGEGEEGQRGPQNIDTLLV